MVLGDISCGKDERIRGASPGIHHDPAPGFQPRIKRQLQIEIDADPDHDRIKGFTLAVAVDDRQAVIVLQLQRAAAGTDLHPLLAVDGLQALGHLAAHRAHAERRLLLEQGDRHAAFPRGSGNLKANPAAADNREFVTFHQATFQALRVLPVAQGIDLRMAGPRLRRQARPTAGSD